TEANLSTKIKSPSSKVGIMEPEGMRNGSSRNERISRTRSRIGKNDFAYSTTIGSRTDEPRASAASRPFFNTRLSKSQTSPVTNVATTRISAKSTSLVPCWLRSKEREYWSFLVDLQHGQEGLLGYLDRP